ncbi:TPA: hypothetical protein ACN33E_001566 [Vibrio parahaemolyticus]|uniref:hypothetical protein n=1 Tax=Vibrio TaxID=662 RepID=UPI0012AD2C8F|nr:MULTISPECIES: hypothetical protein [Vibrio]EID4336470.1 hypothetical protein [Vibrio vulnificus]MBY7905129.1 hypothetical protein [Vibrio fluvialis]EGQ8704888.1 hypothetical protein [Vibrio parahaemolyticus]EGQ9162550.1 hypothetical protein [Vibrio parahaemolyticus]EGR3461861.1 hypothetical protein [Vibrio parahaemolyticus]
MTTKTQNSHNLNWLSTTRANENVKDWPEWKQKYKLATPRKYQAKPLKAMVSTLTVKTSDIF